MLHTEWDRAGHSEREIRSGLRRIAEAYSWMRSHAYLANRINRRVGKQGDEFLTRDGEAWFEKEQ